ncbi:MAG: hypothetical protein AAFQ64_07090 [Pseudomonadota bacterium]
MPSSHKFEHRHVLKTLVTARGGLSLIEQDFAIEAQVERETADWVPMWVDLEHAVRSTRHQATAYRAITDDGILLWYVRHDKKKRGYHSRASTAVDAFADAAQTWQTRRAIKRNWDQLKALQTDVLMGRKTVDVTIEDARAGGLCTLGIEGFMRRFGIANRTRISGRLAALLMKVEPQMGFALYRAAFAKGLLPHPDVEVAPTKALGLPAT